MLLGVPVADGQDHYTNSVIGISPNPDKPFYRYDKHHLVPFGEFIPTGFRWFVDWMRIPLGDFAAGNEVQQPFAVNNVWIMPNICYEDLFGEEIARQLGENEAEGKPVANLLLNVSNLAWYGESSAIPQHLQISRARALETGRTMLRSTNTGATAIISPKGKVLHLLAFDQQGVISAKVQGYSGITPYVRYRNLPFLFLASGTLLLGWWLGRKK
ncbi:MAG: apolipoprotein N-acyltransferase [Burkholderiales bacterium]|nr:apolipoprotein N-acyltransferase [Burkholderiales bacterium]